MENKKYFLYLSFLYAWDGIELEDHPKLIDEYLKRYPDTNSSELDLYDICEHTNIARLFCDVGELVKDDFGVGIYLPFIGDVDNFFDSDDLENMDTIGECLIDSPPSNGPCCGLPSDNISIYIGEDKSVETLMKLKDNIKDIIKQLNIDFDFQYEMIGTSDEYIFYSFDNETFKLF